MRGCEGQLTRRTVLLIAHRASATPATNAPKTNRCCRTSATAGWFFPVGKTAPPTAIAACSPRPYEGTEVSPETMQAYLDWEYGLVEQLRRDATHGFFVI